MGSVKPVRLVVLSVLLAVTALLVTLRSGGRAAAEKPPLQQSFTRLAGWQAVRDFPMDQKVVTALDLDDYLFRAYHRDDGEVTLYIGYYRSAKKVGAAHDPMVCFSGQGWRIDRQPAGRLALARQPGRSIDYSSIFAQRQDEREVIVYWFQANLKATASTPAQKLAMMLDRISGNAEDNAFVRVSAPVGSGSPDAARQRVFDFIEAFYPEFLAYVSRS